MKMVVSRILLALGLVTIAVPAMSQKPDLHIETIQAKLVYRSTGTLSQDVMDPDVTLWNTVIGEGDATEPADDVMVFVVMKTEGEQSFDRQPIDITVADAKGKMLVRRTFPTVLTDGKGHVSLPVFVPDSTCLGEITITAITQKERMYRKLTMACGE